MITNIPLSLLCPITFPSKGPSTLFVRGRGYFIVAECKMRQQGCSCVITSLIVVTIQAFLKTAHKQRWKAKDAYRGSKCSRSKARVLVEEAAVHSGESRALC